MHDELTENFGENYIQSAQIGGNFVFQKSARERAATRCAKEPSRYSRQIDALLLDDLTHVICKSEVYKRHFTDSLKAEFPLGAEQLRIALDRLLIIRNALSHANPLSMHDIERAFCYSDDIILSLVKHYRNKGMSDEYNTPTFTRLSDHFGNQDYLNKPISTLDYSEKVVLRPGDAIRLEVEVDAHFPPNDYNIEWVVSNRMGGERGSGNYFELVLEHKHVDQSFTIAATLTSTKA